MTLVERADRPEGAEAVGDDGYRRRELWTDLSVPSLIMEHDWFRRPLPDNIELGPGSWLYSAG